MIKSVSLVMAGLLLLLPGFCTDLLGLLLMLPLVQKRLALKLLPYFRIYRSSGPGDGGGFGGGLAAAVIPLTVSLSARMTIVSVWIINESLRPAFPVGRCHFWVASSAVAG